MAEISPLRRRMIDDMMIRNLSPATQQSYLYAVAKFSRHFGRSPDRLSFDEVRAYQLHLIAQPRSWSHINQVVCALRFFYGVTLGRRYPSAEGRLAGRPGLGLIASIGASDGACTGVRDGAMARVEIITGPERRRRWTEEQKRAIVAASLKPGAVVSEVARRAEIGAGQIYRWRQALCAGREGFAQVVIAPAANAEAPPADDPGCCAVPAIEVEFAGEARVRIPASIPVALAAAVVKALSRR
jgi:transposase-like protein